MRFCQVLLISSLVLSSAFAVHADSISPADPHIIVGRPADSTPITSPFAISVDPNGGGISDFENASGKNWLGLILTVTFPDAADAMAAAVSCSNGDVLSNIYSNCSSERHGKTLTITLTGGVIDSCSAGSCPLDTQFFIDLNTGDTLKGHGNPNGKGGWKGDTIKVQSITTPEPATFALLVSGLFGFCVRRKPN